jgi:predicted DNA-binding protein
MRIKPGESMATKHRRSKVSRQRRINVTFKPSTLHAVNLLAKKADTSLSNITQELVEQALEMREDIYLSGIAEEAEIRAKGKARISADKVWKELDLE